MNERKKSPSERNSNRDGGEDNWDGSAVSGTASAQMNARKGEGWL